MKKIIALMILVVYCDFLFGNSFEEMKRAMKVQKVYGCTKSRSTQQRNGEYWFKQNPMKYYKRWSLAYCLGYVSNEDIIVGSGCTSKGLPKEIKNLSHIDNMVRIFGNEAIDELKAYMDRYLYNHKIEQKGSVNMCFDWVYDSEEYQDEIDRIVKKYSEYYK